MKFSFVNAGPNADLDAREGKKSVGAWPPLGILYLAAVLKQRGAEVSVLDQAAKGLSIEETVKWVKSQNPDVLGFSTFATSGRTAALISSEVKKDNPNVNVAFGSYYATFNSERILQKYPWVDITVRGEGEQTILDLMDHFEGKKPLKDIPGISFRNEGKVISTADRPLIKDVSSIPFPDRSLVDDEYHSVIAGAVAAPEKFTSLVSSRGCVYDCRFCSCARFARNRWRPRSVENTMEELLFLASEGYKQFIFVDDNFTANPKNVMKLCREMRREKLDMEWTCEGRVDNASYEMFWEIAKAGCRILYFGIESANQRILDYYNKRITPEKSRTAVKTARKAGADVLVGSFIVGAPDETRAEIQNTIRFANTIPIDIPQFNILGVFPGTELWNECEAKGYLKGKDYWETGVSVSEICPTAVPEAEIKTMMHEGFYKFAQRPSFISKEIIRLMKSGYRKRIVVSNVGRLGEIRESLRSVA
ncbi:MAG TPA: radical SAM protein [candidate division Zixibacteria bacterium]|nr:radical SAM protein [candidate division Zixibacteria bacterium]